MLFSITNPPIEFYVYLYLRKNGTPYYVGKGFGNRAWVNHRINGKGVHIPTDLSKIIIVSHRLHESESLLLETKLISKYGRLDIGTGILRNMTDGGDGTSGYVRSDDLKKRQSEWVINSNNERIENGTHLFQNKTWASDRENKKISNGTHLFVVDNPIYKMTEDGNNPSKQANIEWS